jgi:iron complex outermembrane recepter protein
MMKHMWLLAGAAAVWSGGAQAQAGAAAAGQDHLHSPEPADIIVTAPFVRELDVLAGKSVLTGVDLARDIRPQIGDTLDDLPGVSATSFGPGASRPVLRGFQGERVRVLTDGIGSIDVSNTSADHAVTIDPLTAERVEVLRGPAVLLFGSQAIGGAVNIIDRRIPRVVPDEPVHIDAIGAYGSAANEISGGAGIDLPLGSQFVVHLDGSYRDTDDLEIGGFLLSPELRAEAALGAAAGNEEAEELVDARGVLPNSATRTKTLGGGFSLINEGGSLGFSVGWYDTRYGIPERPDVGIPDPLAEPEEEHADVSIDLDQIRYDVRGELNLDGVFEALRVRVGVADYEHTEFEGDEVGTVFKNDGAEGRFELAQTERNGWRGVTGAQFFIRDLSAVGEEAFLPRNETQQYGLFTLQEFGLGGVGLEAAARYERTKVSSDEIDVSRDFDAFSAALSASYEFAPDVRVGVTGSRAVRAPSAEELFSNGPHVATQAFEIGDPDLKTEKSWGLEGYVRAETGRFTLGASVFANWFDDYIYEAETGLEEDGLPVFRYRQQDARYYGVEVEASATLFEAGGFRFVADGVADYVRATIDDEGPAPRIPPLRLLGGLEAQGDLFDGRVEAEWVDDQNRTAAFETRTDGHTVLNASLAFRPFGRDNATALIVSANNILDADVRRHASFLKDFAPLAGRDIRVTARLSF